LDEILTIDRLINEMNSRNCFDFDYYPQEKDWFKMRNVGGGEHRFFSIMYENGKWEQCSDKINWQWEFEFKAKGRVKRKPSEK